MGKTRDGKELGLFKSNGEHRLGERREEEDSDVWKIVCAIWNKFGYRRFNGSERRSFKLNS